MRIFSFCVLIISFYNVHSEFLGKARTLFNNVAARLECAKLPDDGTCAVLFDDEE